jgi:hypothetical protein
MNKILWKFMRTGLKSDNGENRNWKIGVWRKENDIDICNVGFHASKTPLQALNYVKGEIIARVEVKGKSIIQEDKQCWSEMRIIKAYHWKREDSISLAIYSAELVLDIFEKKYPENNRPRKAIEAAKNYLKALESGDNKKIKFAATAAYAAYATAATAAATATAAAADAAAYAAAYAADAAATAAATAATADAAAYAAYAAATAAARKKLTKKIDAKMMSMIKNLKEII